MNRSAELQLCAKLELRAPIAWFMAPMRVQSWRSKLPKLTGEMEDRSAPPKYLPQPLQLLSAVSHHLRLTLAQVPIAEKSNEIPALKPLLRQLPSLVGTLITADALHCQQDSAQFITQELGGDYLFGLKGNQSGVLERAERLLAQEAFPP